MLTLPMNTQSYPETLVEWLKRASFFTADSLDMLWQPQACLTLHTHLIKGAGVICRQEYEGQLEFDLGNLMACDPSPVDTQALEQDPEAHCLEMATKITQSLVAQLFSLPGQAAPIGRVVHLPPPTTQLPRQKPLPTPRPPTR